LLRNDHKREARSKTLPSSDSGTTGGPRPANGGLHGAKLFAINAFLIFHIIAISCWAIPINTPLTDACKNFLRPYFVWSGVFQSWDMFSPNPKSKNVYLEAVVIYKDGSTRMWTFPRMEMLSLTERVFQERYRKYEEILSSNQFSDLWPDATRRIARLNNYGASPPRRVMLVLRWSDIIPREDGGYDRGPWNFDVFYSYEVKPEDLQ
jgi:hypothetical protein